MAAIEAASMGITTLELLLGRDMADGRVLNEVRIRPE